MRENPYLRKAAIKGLLLVVFVVSVVSGLFLFSISVYPLTAEEIAASLLWICLSEELLFGFGFRINRDLEQYLTTKNAADLEVDEARLISQEDTDDLIAQIDEVTKDIEDELRDLGVSDEELARMKVEFDEAHKDL